ncbi:MAG: sigma-54-dependent Fis family transcriptional regulator [Magnetococcales bacterium]|nr:sigma-54-dependent Fis family transcriptional regulator [Magnetococcales bacterium]
MELKEVAVVVVDDEVTVLRSATTSLQSMGIKEVIALEDGRNLLDVLEERVVGAVILDLTMPFKSGSALLPEIVHHHPEVPVVVLTAAQDADTAVHCMKEGAFDYLVKPVEDARFQLTVKHALEMFHLREHIGRLKRSFLSGEIRSHPAFSGIVSRSRKFRVLFQYAEAVAVSPEPILITGETGVGKELFAHAVHRLSGLKGQFVQVNVAGLDDTLFSDTLFGHRRGAYTGADAPREGLLVQAAGGTLFLDEIGDLTMASQVKLLRFLQDRTYYPLGSDVPKIGDARIICATNRDMQNRLSGNVFRPDLYFRLSVHQIAIPPLREHREDIPLLVLFFTEEAARVMGKAVPKVPGELFTLLANHAFPGNIRELRAMVYNAMALHQQGQVLSMQTFRETIGKKAYAEETRPAPGKEEELLVVPGRYPTLREAETWLVRQALERANGNQGIAAMLLGISRPALNRRLVALNRGE